LTVAAQPGCGNGRSRRVFPCPLKDRGANVGEFIDAIARVAAGGTALDPEDVTGMLNATRHASALSALTALLQ
jgi:hypothetical protein